MKKLLFKKIFLLQLFLSIAFAGYCQQDSINNSYLNLAVFKVGYHDHILKCGSFHYYNLCPNCSVDSLPFDVLFVSPSDFGSITFRIHNTYDTVFYAEIVWFGSGYIHYPFIDPWGGVCSMPSPYTPTNNHVQKPIDIDYFTWYGGKVHNDTVFKQRADSAWHGIDSLLVTNLFSNVDYKVGIFDYNRSTGVIGPVTNANWIVFLYYNPIITNLLENESILNNIKLYPNPASDQLNISSTENEAIQSISIYNLQRKLLFQKEMHQQKTKIDISDFAKGIYFVKVKTSHDITTKKLIVQ